MAIPFTQYLRPHGRRLAVRIDRDMVVEAKAATLLSRGYQLECEVLTNGDCSFTICHPEMEEEGDLDIELSPNGMAVPAAVDRLINRYYSKVINPCSPSDPKGTKP